MLPRQREPPDVTFRLLHASDTPEIMNGQG